MTEFKAWPKIPRLFRDMTVTEKIDGTNAAIIVDEDGKVSAQSRNRLITTIDDNYGFAKWVAGWADQLEIVLGPGHHYGEWWGNGIQRGYGLPKDDKRFSLFNVNRYGWEIEEANIHGLGLVPTLWKGPFGLDRVQGILWELKDNGSYASPGFMRPEGVIVHHSAANVVFKATIENDEVPKGKVS